MSTLVEPRMNDAVLGSTYTKSNGAQEGEKATNGAHSQQIPELNVNGSALPKDSGSSPRASNVSAAPSNAEQDSGWGSNFWVTLIEPQSQTPFYACPATGQVSWDPPVGNFVLPPSEEGEWWELVDENRGLPYYYHTKSNETVWERPEGFIIPLGILQNTALCRRLSARYSQILDFDLATYREQHGKTDKPSANRRSTSEGNGTIHRQGSSASTASQRSNLARGGAVQTPKRSNHSNDQQHRHHHQHHGFGGTQLPTIPGSPYQTEDSAPPTPKSKSKTLEKGKEREAERENNTRMTRASSNADSISRARSKSSASFIQTRNAPPQSLNAAAERIAHETSPINTTPRHQQLGGAPPTPVTPSSARAAGRDGLADLSATFAPQAVSSPARSPPSLTISTNASMAPGLAGTRSVPLSPVSPGRAPNMMGLNAPPLSANPVLGKSKSVGLGISPVSTRSGVSTNESWGQASQASAPGMPRKSMSAVTGSIRHKGIGSPMLDLEATLNLSPVKARAEGRPIFVEGKKEPGEELTQRHSTGGRPVLPEDLASEIQQFVQAEFARQYFTTHRTGFIFRKKIPVEKMMTWQKAPLQAPLLLLNRNLHKDAVRMFKVIQRIMGDRERDRPVMRHQVSDNHLNSLTSSTPSFSASSTSLPSMVSGILEEERWLLTEGLTHGELRDEIYCQVVKQLTGNPSAESMFRGWQLLCVLLVTFPPSKNFEAYLGGFICQHTNHTEGRVDVMAKYCTTRLLIISKKGPRGKPPTISEIETLSDAAFNPSTFGEPLDAVMRIQERTYPHLQVPLILPFLADGILALGGTKSEGIFRIPGDGDNVSDLKIRIERGYYNLEGVDDPHVPASLLKLWLRELADPLVPTELYNDCVACAKDPDACTQMVARLPTMNRRVVLFVISFLQLFLEEKIQSVTKMTSANLALVMAPNLLRCDSDSMTVVFTNAPYEQMFVHNLLLHLKCTKLDPSYVPKHGLGSAVVNPPSMGRKSKSRNRPLR